MRNIPGSNPSATPNSSIAVWNRKVELLRDTCTYKETQKLNIVLAQDYTPTVGLFLHAPTPGMRLADTCNPGKEIYRLITTSHTPGAACCHNITRD